MFQEWNSVFDFKNYFYLNSCGQNTVMSMFYMNICICLPYTARFSVNEIANPYIFSPALIRCIFFFWQAAWELCQERYPGTAWKALGNLYV